MRYWVFIVILSVCFYSNTKAQQPDSVKTQIQKQLEEVFEETDDEEGLAGEQLTQFLEDLAANPVNINTAASSDLLQIPGLNLKLVRAILDYRKDQFFEKKQDVLKVKGIGNATYQRIQPYITVAGKSQGLKGWLRNKEYWFGSDNFEVISRYQQVLQPQKGYQIPDSSGGYLGNSVKYYQRIRFTSSHLSLNLTQEKDAGESFSENGGFDFNSFHVALRDNGKLKELVVGDYSLSFGQGLVLWTGGAFGKGREVVGTAEKNERGLRPYSSAQETDFFRGIAGTYGDDIQITAFYSNRARTASVIEEDTVRFPSSSGFHRTNNELNRKNNLDQQLAGGRLRVNTPIGLIGATGYVNQFSKYIGKGSSLNDLYDFEGRKNSVLGLDYRALIGSGLLFGEIARSENKAWAAITGLETAIGNSTDITLLYRNFDKRFQSFLADGFGESSSAPQNEEGFYIALRHSLNRKVTLSTYLDQYVFEAPRSGNIQEIRGFDVLGLAEVKFSRKLNMYGLLRYEVKDEEAIQVNDSGMEQRILSEAKRSSIRLHMDYNATRALRLRSRIELVGSQEPGEPLETGFLIYQDMRVYPIRKLQFDLRLTFFETDSFDARVYQFENDLLYVLSNQVLSGKGQRAYLVIKYELNEKIDIWMKYASTLFEDQQIIRSGLNEIEGNRNNSVGFQVRISL